ncbi:PREDICTED: putative late blight resistance protein homolog R1A-4 isoform X2 [Ipomoea nil]|uniref:putative late blight resistance protein homolog R1A-4 isoform X2 n=1 Tax=Ipomoea nil TaxID=35883 RepID=UPI000901B525|nr:PREDICTED: putative late blight resistance protein homolog R1A-4 isoform X2 [Ipomoea nil]
MACVPLTSLMNTIHFEFLQPCRAPVILAEDTAHLVSSLHHNLGFLLTFLEEFQKKPGNDDAAIKDLEAKIRDFAFLAEDEVESNLAKIYMEAADKEMTLFQNLQQVLGEDAEMILFQNLRQVAEKTQNFVNGIKREYNDSAVQDLTKVQALPLSSHEWISKIEDRMIGRRRELKTIKNQLIHQPSKEGKVISILGMGGIGKTTLAKSVYEDPSVLSYFDLRAWTTVSQEVNMRQILCSLLWSIQRGMNTEGSTLDELAHKLRQRLMGMRYLIVVDDVWETNVWDYLTRCFPKSYGSVVLVTSRLREIADYTTSGASNLLHDLHFLNSDKSWDLFCSHIFLKQPLHSKFNTIGRNIVGKCGGLPLAIVVAAGLVSQFSKVEELEKLEKEMSYLASTDIGEQCSRILIVSYNHLPPHLKACFLYLGVFSAGSEIPIKKLVRLWIAEGFVKLVSDKELEEVGVGYLHDLISRSLVQIDKLKCDGQIKTCRMHDLLLGLCVRQATNEKLLCVEDNNSFDMCNIISSKKASGIWDWLTWLGFKSSSKLPKPFDMCSNSKKACGTCRWLSFRSSNLKSEHFDFCNSKARSILCLHKDEIMPMVNDPKPLNFSLLIVLDLTSPLYNKGVHLSALDHLSNIVLLRYLAFEMDRSLGSEGLKNLLSKNKKLQTLIVSHSAPHWQVHCSHLPSTIWGSPQLRHLELRQNFFKVEPPGIVKEDLQVWYWLSIFHCTREVISRIPNVKTLGIFCEDRLIPDDGVPSNDAFNLKNLCYLNHLEVLTIEAEYAIPKRMSLPSIDALPCNLRKLKLSRAYLPWKDNISTIALLPRLEVLKLKMDAFYGPEWEPTEGGFRRLKFLQLENTQLEIWNAFDDEFPILERLALKYCKRLKEIPSSFSTINSLQSIDFESCNPALLTCTENIQEVQVNYGYDIFAVIDRTPQYTFEQRMSNRGKAALD